MKFLIQTFAVACLLAGVSSPRCAAAEETLRAAAGSRFLIGGAIATEDLGKAPLMNVVTTQFDALTPEYELMPSFMASKPGKYTFERGDRVVNFAHDHGLACYGHMLVWHLLSPSELYQDDKKQPLPRDQALTNMREYIQGVVGHYRGKIKAWCVVNEALSDDAKEYLRDTPARKAIGDDYIEKAFEFAHEADPEVALYYNDYNIEQPDKCKKALRLVNELRAKHLRIDAIGVQGHWLINYPPTEMIASGIKAFSDAGLKVMITELDVDILPRTTSGANLQSVEVGENPYPNGLPDEMQQKLAGRYQEIFQTLCKFPAITSVSFWGVADGRSWLNGFPVKNRTNYPLLFDRQYQPKPAFEAVLRVLEQAR